MHQSYTPHRSHSWLALFIVLSIGLSAPLLLAATNSTAHVPLDPHIAITSTTLVLYDGSRNTGTPDSQNMNYLTRPTLPAATQSFADGVTTLTTTQKVSDSAGYSNNPFLMPTFDRTAGFTLHFTVQLVEENHAKSDKNGDGVGDRAGLSILLLGSDHKGIELGFWSDQVWAQQDGSAEPPPNTNTLFTHAEGAPFNPTTAMTTYALSIQGDSYVLASDTTTILSGQVRDYSAFGQPPYILGNVVFLGDNTPTASGTIKLSAVSLVINDAASATATATVLPTAMTTPTVMPVDNTPVPSPHPRLPRVLLPAVRRSK